jgi:hypothetical protein
VGVPDTAGLRSGDRVACAADPETNTMSERQAPQSRAGEQRSESNGAGLLGTVLTLAAIPVGWIAYVVSVLIVANHLMETDLTPTVLSLSPTATFRLAVAVLVVVGFVMLVRPALVLGGWFVIGVLLAGGEQCSYSDGRSWFLLSRA